MRSIFQIALMLSVFSLKCQSYMTYGQVYDYDVGDVLQTQLNTFCGSYNSWSPPTVTTMSVTGKTLTATQVTYTFFENSFTYTCYSCFPIPPTTITYTLTYTLSDTIRKWPYIANYSIPLRSDDFSLTCNRITEKLSFDEYPPINFEPTSESDTYIAGVGGPFFDYVYMKDISCHYKRTQKEFLFCHKQNGQNCPLDLLVNNQLGIKQELIVYPVPSKDKIYVRTGLKLTHYDIFDIAGTVYLHGLVIDNTINIETLKPGEYICAFQTETLGTITTRILKE